MAFCSNCWLLRDGALHGFVLDRRNRNSGSGLSSDIRFVLSDNPNLLVKMPRLTKITPLPQPVQCEKKERQPFDPSKIEPPPYNVYMDSTSGRLEPASGARASIPSQEYWPEGTQEQVRAAQAPAPKGVSKGSPSYGKTPGSRRSKHFNTQAKAADSSDSSEPLPISNESEISELSPSVEVGGVDDSQSETEKDEYVVYQTEEELSGYDLDKQIGNPHPFINPDKARTIENVRPSDDLWWNWKRPERWSRWQRWRPDVDTVFAKAMAETGQIKIFGDEPTVTEAALAKARKHVYKEERLKAERKRLEEIGPIAYYSEWVSAYKHVDASEEAVQRHFEKTGEDEDTQLIRMFSRQTAEEYRIMVGTDARIERDPLAMRMREELIKEIWGGDPVYPTVNYIRDPDEVVDYRGPDFHEPVPGVVNYLLASGHLTPADKFEEMAAKEKGLQVEISAIDKAMSTAVDIGETDSGHRTPAEKFDEMTAKEKGPQVEISSIDTAMSTAVDIGETDDKEESEEEEIEEKEGKIKIEDVGDNWSFLKTSPHIQKPKDKPKKNGPMSMEEAIKDSENLTDFLMDFEEEE